MIKVNGKTYYGRNVSIINGKVFIDGKEVDSSEDDKEINISIQGNVQTMKVDCCDKIEVYGQCGKVDSKNGNIEVYDKVTGDVATQNGDVVCKEVSGSVSSINGNVIHN